VVQHAHYGIDIDMAAVYEEDHILRREEVPDTYEMAYIPMAPLA